MEFIKKNLLAIIVAGAGVLALVLGLVMAGATAEYMGMTNSIDLVDIIFGFNEDGTTGGMSIFGLISFVALVAGIALTIASMFVKDKKLDFIGAILVTVAGILMFLLLTVGTDVKMATPVGEQVMKFTDAYEIYNLGIGAILYGVIAILGGAFGILNKFKKIV